MLKSSKRYRRALREQAKARKKAEREAAKTFQKWLSSTRKFLKSKKGMASAGLNGHHLDEHYLDGMTCEIQVGPNPLYPPSYAEKSLKMYGEENIRKSCEARANRPIPNLTDLAPLTPKKEANAHTPA